MGFTRAELEACRGRTVDDLVGPGLRLLFVGINPSLWTAATGAHFARPGNRFYAALHLAALHLAGITARVFDASSGMTDRDRAELVARGVGITNLVRRATARADELTVKELRAGGRALREFVVRHRPRVVAVAGITAYRQAFGEPGAAAGRQPDSFEGAVLWVVPNPSGLNAHETPQSLGTAYRAAAVAAGVVVPPSSS